MLPSNQPVCRLLVWSLLVLTFVLLPARPGYSQSEEKFTNLRVLPTEITKPELMDVMKEFTSSLGVRCIHCHVGQEGQPLSTFDFAADDKNPKRTARVMMGMVDAINGRYLTQTAHDDHDAPATVSCVTCHRGFTHPATIQEVLKATIERDGVEAGLAQYRELREKYYGASAYDFRERPLSSLAFDFVDTGKPDIALALLRLNAEFYPRDGEIPFLEGMVYLETGDTTAARSKLEQALQLDPENRRVARELENLSGGK
jgi:tetratricopeptide (TPR) repeat protein